MTLGNHEISNSFHVGVVVPARNEEAALDACLARLTSCLEEHDAVLVVDAHSDDRTAAIATQRKVEVVRSPNPMRGYSVAFGVETLLARLPRPHVIVIVHADTLLPVNARKRLQEAFEKDQSWVGGAFGHRIDHPGWRFRLIERGNNARARWLGMPYGDQVQFFCPDRFDEGFPNQAGLEDLELALRMRKAGRVIVLNQPAIIPPRHWQKGIVPTTMRNWGTVIRYCAQRMLRKHFGFLIDAKRTLFESKSNQ